MSYPELDQQLMGGNVYIYLFNCTWLISCGSFKKKSVGHNWPYDYTPPPPINVLATALINVLFFGSYYRGAQGAVIVYDLTNPESFMNLRLWLNELHENCLGVSVAIGQFYMSLMLL